MVMPAAVRKAEADGDAALAAIEEAQKETEEQSSALDAVDLDSSELTDDKFAEDEDVSAETPEYEEEEVAPVEPDFKQKYQTLQGKYNAEVPRLQAELAEMNRKLLDLYSRSAMPSQMGEKLDSAMQKPKGPAHAKYLKKEEVEDYGEDILDMQARMAKGVAEEVLNEKVTPYINRINYLESLVAGNSSQTFWEKVEQEIPGGKEMNDNDPLWVDFLDNVDEVSGLTFREIGERAYDANDSSRIIQLMRLYLEDDGASEAEESPAKRPPVKPGKVAKSSAPKSAEAKPTFRESEVKKFYDDKAVGKYRGREELAKKREKAIEQAFEEGRIVAG